MATGHLPSTECLLLSCCRRASLCKMRCNWRLWRGCTGTPMRHLSAWRTTKVPLLATRHPYIYTTTIVVTATATSSIVGTTVTTATASLTGYTPLHFSHRSILSLPLPLSRHSISRSFLLISNLIPISFFPCHHLDTQLIMNMQWLLFPPHSLHVCPARTTA